MDLKEYIKTYYKKAAIGYTSGRSYNNCDDCFEDGYQCGMNVAIHDLLYMFEEEVEKVGGNMWACSLLLNLIRECKNDLLH